MEKRRVSRRGQVVLGEAREREREGGEGVWEEKENKTLFAPPPPLSLFFSLPLSLPFLMFVPKLLSHFRKRIVCRMTRGFEPHSQHNTFLLERE